MAHSSEQPTVKITIEKLTLELYGDAAQLSHVFDTIAHLVTPQAEPRASPEAAPSATTPAPSAAKTREEEDRILTDAQRQIETRRGADSADKPTDELAPRRRAAQQAREDAAPPPAEPQRNPGAVDAAEQSGAWHCDQRRKMKLLELFAKMTVAPMSYPEINLRDWMDEQFKTRTRKGLTNEQADLLITHCSDLINAWLKKHPGAALPVPRRAELQLGETKEAVTTRRSAGGTDAKPTANKQRRGAPRQ